MNNNILDEYPPCGRSQEAFFEWLRNRDVDTEAINIFRQHKIDEMTFCMLKESDLREMGINKLGVIKRLLYILKIKNPSSCSDSDESSGYRTPRMQLNSPTCESDPKLWKVCISALYCFLSLGVTSYVMVLAHERLPDISKYPPLPDILLDNLPYIPWAFEAAEMICIVLALIWTLVLVFHKHRLILFRRYCSLMGTVFLLRSITMIITSLSVPGQHLLTECKPFVFHSFKERLERAAAIWFGMGMTLQGVRTCGDYMFSGHTTVITLLNFFITEYTPQRLSRLHNLTWMLNGFGVFFILAAHEHYSIDVFIAIYISTRLFLYYHWQADNQHASHHDKHRDWIWFPILTFFECDVQGPVPHEYSNPVKDFLFYWKKYQPSLHKFPLALASLCLSSPSSPKSDSNGVIREKGE
ncbi:unnamed protein product [Hymenolepis diminuta]|uniref:SAM domain-containing protein n=1 Tax=Hymenolepis diminuta TaxID=6216 RepID=A0A0R3SPH6_HYMDI|nr:unnamed protein product [Hymenolepis diminuta]